MKVRLPNKFKGMNSFKGLAEKAQQMQSEMEKASNELNNKDYTFSSGGGAVKATMKGSFEVTNLEINSDIIDKDNKDMLEEIVIAAINGVIKMAQDDKDQVMEGISQKSGISPDITGMF